MDEYKIIYKKSVYKKDFKKINNNDLKKIINCIENLKVNPRPTNSKKLTDMQQYSLRQGNYRILYSINDSNDSILIVKVADRKKVYR